MSFQQTVKMSCDHPGCKNSFELSSEKMSRGELVQKSREKGWKFVDASKQLCAEHASKPKKEKKAKASKTAKTASKFSIRASKSKSAKSAEKKSIPGAAKVTLKKVIASAASSPVTE